MFTNPTPLIDLVFSGLSIYRWNTFPRLREISALDHLAFVAHISLLLAFLREEEEGVTYDHGLLLRKVLFSGCFTFIYSDMSSEVKDRLRESSPELYNELEMKAYDTLKSDIHSPRIHTDIDLSLGASPEDELVSFAKIWASYHEIHANTLPYPDAYIQLKKSILKRADRSEYKKFLTYIDFNSSNQSDVERYLLVTHRLASSYRWNRSVRKYPVSVLSHTYIVAFLSYLIGIEKRLQDSEITDMIMTALYHDIPEAITGDIITPTKLAVAGLNEAIGLIEEEMVDEYLLSSLGKYTFSSTIRRKMLTPWNEPYGDLVKLADRYSALYEAKIEAPQSEEYQKVYEKLKKKIEEITA